MGLSVIGAGFGRTGTLSLKAALERLGLGPCYHMLEVFKNPDHIAIWDRAAGGAAVDWDALFQGYRSAVDWPVCRFYRELAEHYPDAKVILTVRDPGKWFRSAWDTIFPVITSPAPDPIAQAQAVMARKIIAEQTFGGRLDDREHAIAVFHRHIEEVRKTIPPERLLAYELREGWEPLCRFLGRPVPDEPFPKVNTTEDFRRMIAAGRPDAPK
jgi:hypothetical protein